MQRKFPREDIIFRERRIPLHDDDENWFDCGKLEKLVIRNIYVYLSFALFASSKRARDVPLKVQFRSS